MRATRDLWCFFFNDTATTEIYTLSLHDALPISEGLRHHRPDHLVELGPEARVLRLAEPPLRVRRVGEHDRPLRHQRSEEHTSELQSRQYLVCRLLLEKKKN